MKRQISMLLVGVLLSFSVGCSKSDTDSSDQVSKADLDQITSTLTTMNERLDTMDTTINDFIDEYDYNQSQNANSATASPDANGTKESSLTEDATSSTTIPENFDEYKTSAEELLYSIKNNTSTDMEKYQEYTKQIKAIENKLDEFEDAIELQYSKQQITKAEYKKYDTALEDIEDILDQAEDQLETKFGIDD